MYKYGRQREGTCELQLNKTLSRRSQKNNQGSKDQNTQHFISKRRPSALRLNTIASESPGEGDGEAESSGAPDGPRSGSRLVITPFSGS